MHFAAIVRAPDTAPIPAHSSAPTELADRIAAIRAARTELADGVVSAPAIDLLLGGLRRGGLLVDSVVASFGDALRAGGGLPNAALRAAARLADEALREEDAALSRFARRFPAAQASEIRMLLAAAGQAVDPLTVPGPVVAAGAATDLASPDAATRARGITQLGQRR